MNNKKPFEELGQRIKDLRGSFDPDGPLTQEKFGEQLGVNRSQVSAWEAGKESPSNEKLVKLGNMASPPGRFWFYEQAGMDMQALEGDVRKRLASRRGEISLGEVIRVPRFDAPALLRRLGENEAGAQAEPADLIPFPSLFISDPASAICVRATPLMAGPQVQPDDLILIDSTQRDLVDFLNCFVAVASEDVPLSRLLKPEIVRLWPRGRPLTERDRREIELNLSRDPLVRAEEDRRADELMAKILKEVLPEVVFGTLRLDIPEGTQNESREGLSEGIPWRLILEGGFFTSPLTPWSIEKFQNDATLAFPETRRLRVLGTVTCWLRAPGAPILKERGAPIERGRPDE